MIAATTALFGCAPAVAPVDPSSVEPPPKFGTLAGGQGEQANVIIGQCARNARSLCPNPTIRCDAYVKSYVKSCVLDANVPPEYLLLMMQ